MSTEENKAVVHRYFEEAWNQNKVAELDEYIAAKFIHHSGTVVQSFGPEPNREVIKIWRTGLPDFQYQLENLIAEGDLVVALVTFTGTHTGTFRLGSYTLPPSGKPLREAEILIFRIADGKIVESWATWDRLSLLKQLGVVPAPEQGGS
jgi:predicted ester cyclase